MKKTITLIIGVLMACAVFLGVAGCQLDSEQTNPGSSPKPDKDAVVASVGNKYNITYEEYEDLFNSYVSFYQYYGGTVPTGGAELTEFQDSTLDMMLEEKVLLYKAIEGGYDQLTADEQAELEEKAEKEVEDTLAYYRDLAEKEAAEDDTIDVDARIREMIEEEAPYYTGKDMSYDEYLEFIKTSMYEEFYVEKLYNETLSDLTATDDEIQDWYDEALEADKKAFEEDPGSYKDEQEEYELNGGSPAAYAPEGYSRILHIFITSEESLPDEYETKTKRMDEIKTEYGKLAFESALDGNDKSADLKKLMDEYNTLARESQELFDSTYAKAKTSIDEAYGKLQAGEPFADVMKDYTQDADYTSNDVFAQKGMLINPDVESEVDWSDEIKTEFKKLKTGTYSQVFMDDDGYHIIHYLGDEPSGAIELSTIKEEAKTALINQKKEAEWKELITQWLKDESIIKRNVELIRHLGQA